MRWKSDTTGLPSKKQIARHRSHLIQNGRGAEAADADYANRAADLEAAIGELSARDREAYFRDIGEDDPGDIETWLTDRERTVEERLSDLEAEVADLKGVR